MKKLMNIIVVLLTIFIGSLVGNLLNANEINAQASCENLACKYDFIGGFRCFNDGTDGYNCSDTAYPSCSETICGPVVPGEN